MERLRPADGRRTGTRPVSAMQANSSVAPCPRRSCSRLYDMSHIFKGCSISTCGMNTRDDIIKCM